jgi:predicted MPP superfamily phosphohydrolase
MREFFPILFSMVTIAILSGVEIFLLRKLHRDWWQHRWVRRISYGLPLTGFGALLLWTIGIMTDIGLFEAVGAYTSSAVFVFGVALMLSLPFSAMIHLGDRAVEWVQSRRHRESGEPAAAGRRAFLKTSSAVFPLFAITAGGKGINDAMKEPVTPEIPLYFPGLPDALHGFRIVHISDVHIGLFLGLPDLERMVELSSPLDGDLVLVTGDFADDASVYDEALRIVAQVPNRYGVLASIGNHEYFRGIRSIMRSYERGPVPLLLDSGTAIDVGGTTLYVGGADDPRSIRRMPESFFPQTIDSAMRDAPSEAFTVLMSHRPSGFDHAAHVGIDLTLAGHTHGGQIGFNGRSLLYGINPEKYLWGLYRKNDSLLYTSSGAGHWFPYRLGCPAEIPVYELRRGHGPAA